MTRKKRKSPKKAEDKTASVAASPGRSTSPQFIPTSVTAPIPNTPRTLTTKEAEAEAASCEGAVTECEVPSAMKQVGLNKLPGLDGLPYEVYLRISHMFVPILTNVFNHWLAQGAIPGSITKGVITLLKKGGKHVRGDLDDYRPITLLNTELKILARVLANRLQLVSVVLLRTDQITDVKGRSIRDNLHLVRQILEGIKDNTKAALINLDQSKAFDRVDQRFLAAVLETAGFKLEFRKWINILYHNPQAVMQVNGSVVFSYTCSCSITTTP